MFQNVGTHNYWQLKSAAHRWTDQILHDFSPMIMAFKLWNVEQIQFDAILIIIDRYTLLIKTDRKFEIVRKMWNNKGTSKLYDKQDTCLCIYYTLPIKICFLNSASI